MKRSFVRAIMSEIQRILFSPHLYVGRGIAILRIEGFQLPTGPFLKYARDGQEVAENLRVRICSGLLDGSLRLLLLDHLEAPEEDQVLRAALPRLTALLAKTFSKTVPTGNQKTRV